MANSISDKQSENVKQIFKEGTKLAKLHDDSPIPDEITRWIARLSLLYGVPFNYMVGADAMLPIESIRFFHFDANWVTALIDGAYSIGRVTECDAAHDKVFWKIIHQAAREEAKAIRACTHHPAPKNPAKDAPMTVISGFLLRSELVSGWPGLEICGFSDVDTKNKEAANELPLLRLERILPNVLLALFEGELNCLKLHGPPEGLCFGFEKGADEKSFSKGKIGKIPMRDEDKKVVNIKALADSIGNKVTAADFAKQMIEKADRVTIRKTN